MSPRIDHGHDHDEAALDQFIDDLGEEKEPRVYQSGPVDPEMEKLFETVRAVRRLRGRRPGKATGRRRVGGWIAAAALLLVVLGLSVIRLPGVDLAWPGTRRAGIVEAAAKAYEELHSYSGVFEIRNERDGAVENLERVEIRYQKPGRYFAVHRSGDYEQRFVSDGEKMIADAYGEVTVENLFPEKELWRYHIGTVIRELARAETVETLGTETLFGREAVLLKYCYPDSGPGEYGRVWIDSATYLPLRKELFHPDGSVLVVEFKELAINPPLEAADFAWTPPEGVAVTVLNHTVPLEQVKESWPEVEKLLPAIEAEMELAKAGRPGDGFFEYVLRFLGETEHDYLDLYYTTSPREFAFDRHAKFGLLGEGYVELNPNAWNVFKLYTGGSRTARWVTGGGDVFIVSSRGVDYLQALLEELSGQKAIFKTYEEMIELGLEPVIEKEGH